VRTKVITQRNRTNKQAKVQFIRTKLSCNSKVTQMKKTWLLAFTVGAIYDDMLFSHHVISKYVIDTFAQSCTICGTLVVNPTHLA
jgi:hypothetical protein